MADAIIGSGLRYRLANYVADALVPGSESLETPQVHRPASPFMKEEAIFGAYRLAANGLKRYEYTDKSKIRSDYTEGGLFGWDTGQNGS